MTIFDLIFLAAVLISAVTLATAAVCALRGRGKKSLKILRIYGLCLVVYFLVALGVDFFRPQRVIAVGEPFCLDDWCLQVEKVNRTSNGSIDSYDIDLRVFSTARRISQRAKGAWIYLIDEHGRRYSPDFDPSAIPLDVQLGPQQSLTTSRVFAVPADVNKLGLITGHGGPYCGMGVLIIGEGGCLFNKPTMIRIQRIGRTSFLFNSRFFLDEAVGIADNPIYVNCGHPTLPINRIRCYFMSELTDLKMVI